MDDWGSVPARLSKQQRLLFFLPQLTLACPFFGEGSQGHPREESRISSHSEPVFEKVLDGAGTFG